MNLSNILKDPIDILLLLIYVTGVLILVYSAMQFIHGILYKDKSATRSGIKTLIISLVLLIPRLSYQHFRIDGSDYKKYVKASLSSMASVQKSGDASLQEDLKSQMDASAERLSDESYEVSIQSSVEKGVDGDYTIRTLSAIKPVSGDVADADIILITTSPDITSESDYSYAADMSVIEALAQKLSGASSTTEIRFLISTDESRGQDAARYYIDSLDESVKERIRCAIDFDMQSLSDYTGLQGYTVNGRSNPIAGELTSSVKKMTGQSLDIKQQKDAQYIAFHLENIPSVYIQQATVEESSAAKAIDDLDIDQIADVAAAIGDAILPSLKSGDSELLKELRQANVSDICAGTFLKGKDTFITGASLRELEEAYGTSLETADKRDGDGSILVNAKLYILAFDDASDVMFHIENGRLLKITADTGKLPVSREELSQILNNLFGSSQKTDHGLVWTDEDSGAYYYIEDTTSPDSLMEMTSGGYSFYIKASKG